MANNTAKQNGIKNSWSLLAFARTHGKMKVGTFTNGETGEMYKGVAFVNPTDNSTCFVSFSSNLGEKTPAEIAAAKDSLQVVELNVDPEVAARRAENGRQAESYCLCAVGQNAWEDVDLDI